MPSISVIFRGACLLVVLAIGLRADPMPAELKDVLKPFLAEGSHGWAFTQTTRGDGKSLVERFDPSKPEFHRWTLMEKNGHPPTPEETKTYNELQTRRSRGETAPNVKDQLNEATCEKIGDDSVRASFRFRLRATDKRDTSAEHMTATFTLHRPTSTIERVELGNVESFSPVWFVSVDEARTTIDYHLPEGDRPTLLKQITVKLRGRSWWIKAMNQDMTVDYSDYALARKK